MGKKIRARIAKKMKGEDDLPGMLMFSAALLALLLLMGWVKPGHAAEWGAGQDAPAVRVERAVPAAPAAPASPSAPAPATDLAVGNYLLNATVYRVSLPADATSPVEIIWDRDRMEPRLARRLRGVIVVQGTSKAPAPAAPAATLADYLGQFGKVEVAFSQSQPFLPGRRIEFFGGKEEPYISTVFHASGSSQVPAYTQQSLSSGVSMEFNTTLHNENRMDIEYEISIDESFPVAMAVKSSVTVIPGERQRAVAPRSRAGVRTPADEVLHETNTTDDAAPNAPDAPAVPVEEAPLTRMDSGAREAAPAPAPDFKPREQSYDLIGRFRTNMDGALAIQTGEIVVLKHQRATTEGRPVVFVVALEIAK